MQKEKIIALIPCLNEEGAVSKVINEFRKIGVKEIIVSDGHSTDNTAKVARQNGAKVILVRKGKGNGFRDLLSEIKLNENKNYVMIDGDYTYLPKELPKLIEKMEQKKADIVMGKRPLWAKNHRNARELFRNFVHTIGNLIISFTGSALYLNPTRDICTGYWIFRGKALQKIKPKLTAEHFELEADLFSTASKLGLKIIKVKIEYKKRIGKSKLRFFDAFTIIKKLFTNRIN